MSDRVTLQELTDMTANLVVTDNFPALANRAAKRLYSKGAAPGAMVRVSIGADSTASFPDPGTSTGFVGGDFVSIDLNEYDHAACFQYKGTTRYIIPVEATFSDAGYDPHAFVDHGSSGGDDVRLYQRPEDLEKLDTWDFDALLRKTYKDVVTPSDTFPFENPDAIKLAVLATVYEDENDAERARIYWADALAELESDSGQYRGPQVLNITYYDPASAEATSTIN